MLEFQASENGIASSIVASFSTEAPFPGVSIWHSTPEDAIRTASKALFMPEDAIRTASKVFFV